MRWIISTLVALLVALALFMASPFVALYRLGRAVKAHDTQTIEQRVDIAEVRTNFTRQLIEEYLRSIGKSGALGGVERQVAAQAGATFADPLVARLVTPDVLIDLFDDGWPQQVVSENAPSTPVSIGLNSLGRALRLFALSESRGFRKVIIALPENRPADERFRLQLRLTDGSWRVTTVDLPHTLLQNLVRKLPRSAAAALRE